MFRIWAKEWKENHLLRQITIEDDTNDTRTHKVFHALTKACMEFDLPEPVWLDNTVRDFQKHAKCRFYQDAFIEEIDFDYLELHVIEEDDTY